MKTGTRLILFVIAVVFIAASFLAGARWQSGRQVAARVMFVPDARDASAMDATARKAATAYRFAQYISEGEGEAREEGLWKALRMMKGQGAEEFGQWLKRRKEKVGGPLKDLAEASREDVLGAELSLTQNVSVKESDPHTLTVRCYQKEGGQPVSIMVKLATNEKFIDGAGNEPPYHVTGFKVSTLEEQEATR